MVSSSALGEKEEPRLPLGDPRKGGLGLLCAKPLRRTGNHDMVVILEKIKLNLYNHFNASNTKEIKS